MHNMSIDTFIGKENNTLFFLYRYQVSNILGLIASTKHCMNQIIIPIIIIKVNDC